MKIPYFCCIGAELKRYAKDFDFMNQVYLYKVPTDDTMEEVLAQDYFQAVADTVLQDDIVYIYEPTTEMLYACHFNKQNGHITAEQMANNIPSLTPDKILISDATGHITAGDVSLDFVKNKLTDLENNKVNIDGSSTMTGPLKFRAGSFSGAIAGGLGDGVSIYKIKADGNIDSEVASLTKTNGFTPGTTNAQNIGSPTLKWKDAHVARIITAVLNNGYDIAVPVTNGPDTLALKSEVDNAANSGRMITDTGVWYAKMYSASTVPTGAEYDGTNYADFSQTDGDGNPVIKIYTGASGAWTLTDTITPPDNYDGYVPVTKKIWDIVEQTGQQGGRVLWNHQSKEFTPYPNIVDLSNVANTDMDNLTDTGKNISNWSSNVSNHITEIPQDIKLELNNGTLTLKAGSKLYVPNGAGVFDEVTVASDIIISATGGAAKYMLFYNRTNSGIWFAELTYQNSGTTPSGDGFYYNTSTNKIVFLRSGVADPYEFSFPIGIVTSDSTKYTSINQVFNGSGYIGSVVFALLDKGQIADGRNTDGTLKSTAVSQTSVATLEIQDTSRADVAIFIKSDHTLLAWGRDGGNVVSLATKPAVAPTTFCRAYIEDENLWYHSYVTTDWEARDGTDEIVEICAVTTDANRKITDFRPKSVFKALDYNDTEFIGHQAAISNKYIDITPGASGTIYNMPADGYLDVGATHSDSANWEGIVIDVLDDNSNFLFNVGGTYNLNNQPYWFLVPVSKNFKVQIWLNGSSFNRLRFIYDNGSV